MSIVEKLKDMFRLIKPNLTFMVVISSVIGYLIASKGPVNLWLPLLVFIGGVMVTGSANAINQILEIDTDAIMTRTQTRPLPQNRLSKAEAWAFALVVGITGVVLFGMVFNWLAAGISFISLLIYAFAYTPLKRISPIAVFVGAFPGAFPPLIGWTAASGSLELGAWVLFSLQFFWQFPHFWAIGWLAYDDYTAAGMKMLPSAEGKTRFTGIQCMLYSIVLIPMPLLARMEGFVGNMGVIIAIVLGFIYFLAAVNFFVKNNDKAARQLMYTSFFYLPLTLLALLIDKI